MRYERTGLFAVVISGLVAGSAPETIALERHLTTQAMNPVVVPGRGSTMHAEPAQFGFPTPRTPPIQGLSIKSGASLREITSNPPRSGKLVAPLDDYAFAVMLNNGASNKPFCEALLRNLQFLSPEVLALAEGDPPMEIHSTILYDKRSDDELRIIPRSGQLTKDDCDELVPNHDYNGTLGLATRLGIKIGSGGPWIVVVEPNVQSAVIFDFAKQTDKFDAGIDKMSEILQDPELWNIRRTSLRNFFAQFSSGGPPIRVEPLPRNFPR